MKKIAIICGMTCLLTGFAANAEVSIGVDFGIPQPSYIEEPGPAYVTAPVYPAYYAHRHYHHRPDRHDHDHHH